MVDYPKISCLLSNHVVSLTLVNPQGHFGYFIAVDGRNLLIYCMKTISTYPVLSRKMFCDLE